MLPPHVSQTWTPHKPAASGRAGVVVAQAHDAAAAGIAVLEAGGNAADAAVATAFALAATEPWNSGLGGIGFAVVQAAGERRATVVDFGPVSPAALDPRAFPLTGRRGADLFGWPEVVGEANVHGPLSLCVPAAVAGYAAIHARWGRLPWREVLQPALDLARAGLPYDWYAALRVTQSAALLRRYPETARLYLQDGLPREAVYPPRRLSLGALGDTLARLAEAGAEDFYRGQIAAMLVADTRARGGALDAADLARCQAVLVPAEELPWRGGALQAPGAQTAGPALFAVMQALESAPIAATPDAAWYAASARALRGAQAARLGADGSTSHFCVADAEGGMVALTTTLLSLFGSRMVLPQTGVLMNNGVMWFDPRPGARNAIAGGARPLTNMCPVIWRRGDVPALAAGASGGRRILPAVAQMVSFVLDFGLTPEQAAAQPRIDTSEPQHIAADPRLPDEVIRALEVEAPVLPAPALVSPGLYAAPSLVLCDTQGVRSGVADAASPWSAALAQPEVTGLGDLFAPAVTARITAPRRAKPEASPAEPAATDATQPS